MLYMTIESAAFPHFYVRYVEKTDWEKTKKLPDVSLTASLVSLGVPDSLIGEEHATLLNTYYHSLFDISIFEFEQEMLKYGIVDLRDIKDQHIEDVKEEDNAREVEYAAELGLDKPDTEVWFFFYRGKDFDGVNDSSSVSFNTNVYNDANDGAMPDQCIGDYLNKYRNVPHTDFLDNEVCENTFALEETEFEGDEPGVIAYLESFGFIYKPEFDFTD